MREKLAKLTDRRAYTATFARYGSKQPYKGPPIRTLLFRDLTTGGTVVADHQWFKACAAWDALGNIQAGDRVSFTASVKTYQKGYRGRREDFDLPAPSTDYKLAWPKDARLVEVGAKTTELQFRLAFE